VARCPDGHESTSDDYCDICGMLIAGASGAAGAAAGSGAGVSGAASGVSGAAGVSGGGPVSGGSAGGADSCPACGTPKSGGVFCEGCGYNFSTAQPPPSATPDPDPVTPVTSFAAAPVPPLTAVTPDPSPAAGPSSTPASSPATPATPPAPVTSVTGWSVVVAADRAYYDSVEADSGPDGSGIPFPGYCPERRFQLAGQQMQIGRRSPSRGLEPEIDLTGPPTDPGISRLHAVLLSTPDGWAVLDPGSSNGTQLNGTDLITGVQAPVHDGDRITLGAWTAITVRAT
jgi:hypothetical protein